MIKKLWEFAQIISDVAKSPKTKETLAKTKAILSKLFSKDPITIWEYDINRRKFLRNAAILAGGIYIWNRFISSSDGVDGPLDIKDKPSYIHHFIDKDIIDKLPKTWNEEFDNFWSNPEYFTNMPKWEEIKSRTIDNWYFIEDDAWLKFWVTQESHLSDINEKAVDWKTKRDVIIEELSKIDEFSYLSGSEYKEKIRSFNTSNWQIPINAPVPIPMKIELREFKNDYFIECAELWIQTILKHPKYWPKIQEHIDRIWINEFAKNLTALARNESSLPGKNIWYYEYHRYEWPDKKYSYSPFHILMREWEPWFDGREELWLSEWQTYHPFFASILACVFLCNKKMTRKWARKLCSITKEEWPKYVPLVNFFPIREETKDIIAYLYNWPRYKTTWQNYDQRLLDNLNSL